MTKRIAIIGSGPAGYVGALHASALGARVTLIEQRRAGGTCVHRGCIPTKAMVASSALLERFRRAEQFGIRVTGDIVPSWPDIRRRADGIVATVEAGVTALLRDRQISLIEGQARFIDEHIVYVSGHGPVQADCILVATGSQPARPAGVSFDDTRIVTSDEALRWRDLPSSLAILGEGIVGCEFAFIFRALGVDVSVVGMADRPLPREDRDISNTLLREMRKRRIRFVGGTVVDSVADGGAVVECRAEGRAVVSAERVLVAVGRQPNVEGLGLEAVPVTRGQRGEIIVDAHMRTSCPSIYAAGDVTGQLMLAHVGSAQARAAVDHALRGESRPIDLSLVPRATFTDPEVASVGLTEQAAASAGIAVQCGSFDLRGLGRAQASGELAGMVKVVAEAGSKRLLGAHMIGPHAAEMIHEAAALLTNGATVEDLLRTVHGHPTLSEAVYEAAEDIFGQSIHKLLKRSARAPSLMAAVRN